MPPPEAAAPVAEPRRHRSVGERIFDWSVYGGIAGVGAFVATVPAAYLLKYGRLQWFDQSLSKGFERILKAVGPASWDHAKVGAKMATTTTLMQGGNAMLLPIGIAEKYKVPIVEKINHALGDHTPPAQVEDTQKQTWGSLIKARVMAWVVVFTSFTTAGWFVPKSFQMFETEFGERVCKLLRRPTEIAGKETKTFIYGKIGALDIFATAAAAVLLYIGGHIFAERAEERRERRAAEEAKGRGQRDIELETAPLEAPSAKPAPETNVNAVKHAGSIVEPARVPELQLG